MPNVTWLLNGGPQAYMEAVESMLLTTMTQACLKLPGSLQLFGERAFHGPGPLSLAAQ